MRTSVQGWCYHSFERWATYQGWNVLDKQNVEKLKMQKRIECAKVWSFFLAAIATLYLHRYLSDWFMIINLSHRPMSRRYLTFLTKTLESWEQISSHFRISNDPPLPDFPHETSQVLRTNEQPFQDFHTFFFSSAHIAALLSLGHCHQGHHTGWFF